MRVKEARHNTRINNSHERIPEMKNLTSENFFASKTNATTPILASICIVTASGGSLVFVICSLRAEDAGERGVGGKASLIVSTFALYTVDCSLAVLINWRVCMAIM